MINLLIPTLTGIELIRYAISHNRELINVDKQITGSFSKHGVKFSVLYITVAAPVVEELGFRVVPWFMTHSLLLVGLLTFVWWVIHVSNFKYVSINARVKALYIAAIGLGGISYVIALLINPLLPIILHVVNNSYSIALTKK